MDPRAKIGVVMWISGLLAHLDVTPRHPEGWVRLESLYLTSVSDWNTYPAVVYVQDWAPQGANIAQGYLPHQ
eukprot:1196052-Prorocentrum_minimum.AAC.5